MCVYYGSSLVHGAFVCHKDGKGEASHIGRAYGAIDADEGGWV